MRTFILNLVSFPLAMPVDPARSFFFITFFIICAEAPSGLILPSLQDSQLLMLLAMTSAEMP
jgi:hypothetical protein